MFRKIFNNVISERKITENDYNVIYRTLIKIRNGLKEKKLSTGEKFFSFNGEITFYEEEKKGFENFIKEFKKKYSVYD